MTHSGKTPHGYNPFVNVSPGHIANLVAGLYTRLTRYYPLSTFKLELTDSDLAGHIGIFGMPNPTPESAVIQQQIQRDLLSAHIRQGGGAIYLTGRHDPEISDFILQSASQHGRAHDVLRFTPDTPEQSCTYNPLHYSYAAPEWLANQFLDSLSIEMFTTKVNRPLMAMGLVHILRAAAEQGQILTLSKLHQLLSSPEKARAFAQELPDEMFGNPLQNFLQRYTYNGQPGGTPLFDEERYLHTFAPIVKEIDALRTNHPGLVRQIDADAPQLSLASAVRDQKLVYLHAPDVIGSLVMEDLGSVMNLVLDEPECRPEKPVLIFFDLDCQRYSPSTDEMISRGRAANLVLVYTADLCQMALHPGNPLSAAAFLDAGTKIVLHPNSAEIFRKGTPQ